MSEVIARLTTALADRYAIERELGAGGMATVYLAEDLKHKRKVAVKVLRPELAAVLGPDRFLREIEIAAQLHHPHILALYDSGEADGFLYYVMPLVKGQSLRDRLAREGALPVIDAVRILRDVMDALAEAHDNGVVHRDIKPDNVMLSGRHALVMDFGVAKAVSEAGVEQNLTTAGMALGTPAYMAPEQTVGDPNVDHRADIYAAGVMAYEMLSGETPFTGTNAQQILSAHVMEEPVQLSKHREKVPIALNDLVMRCLQKKVADRWQSAAEVLPHLDSLATSGGSVGVPAVRANAVTTKASLLRVAVLYAVSAVGTAAVAYGLMYVLGLPGWVFVSALVLLVVGLPVAVLTGHAERQSGRRFGGLFTWRRSRLLGAVAFGMLAFVASAFMTTRALGIGPAATLRTSGALGERGVIVFADFENHTEDTLLAFALGSALRDDLSQSSVINFMDPEEVRLALLRMELPPRGGLDVEVARALAEREGAEAVLLGDVSRIGSSYMLSARLESAEGETLLRVSETADNEAAIIDALARLSRRLRTEVGESFRELRSTPALPRVTTHSLEALRKFAEGVRWQSKLDYGRAIPLFEEAVALDSVFVGAYRRLITAYGRVGRRGDELGSLRTAYRLRGRVTEIMRLEIEGFYFGYLGDYVRAVVAFERIRDITGRASNNLAFTYGLARRLDDAERAFREYHGWFKSENGYGNLVSILVTQEKFEEADSILREFHTAIPDNRRSGFTWASLEYARGDRDRARGIFDSLSTVYDTNLRLRAEALRASGWIALTQGRVNQAQRLFDQRFEVERTRRAAGVMLDAALDRAAITILVRARLDSTRWVLDNVAREVDVDQIDPLDRQHLRFVELAARGGDPELARWWMERWRSDLDTLVQRFSKEQPAALGELALAEGDARAAVEHFREWDRVIGACGMCVLPSLARAYEAAGQVDSARAAYRRFIESPFDGRFQIDAWELPKAHLRLGELHETAGDNTNAATYYGEFVELWSDADPEFQPLVADVRQRIARLAGERRD